MNDRPLLSAPAPALRDADPLILEMILDAATSLRGVAFTLETIAHLRGNEAALLPHADALRESADALTALVPT